MGQIDQIAELLGQFACQKVEMSPKHEAAQYGAELTLNLVERHVENSQIDEVTECRGKAAYRKMAIVSTKITRSDRMLSGLPSSPQKNILSSLRFVRAPHSGGIPPVNL